jgi:peptidoglycan/LPS O-acetylase OafA/YrhL
MTIDANAAGLLAQVIPVLLVFLALEDRLRPASIRSKNWRKWIARARELSVILSLASLFMCLLIVVAKVDPGLMSWVVILSMAFVLLTLFILFALKFGREAIEEAEETP